MAEIKKSHIGRNIVFGIGSLLAIFGIYKFATRNSKSNADITTEDVDNAEIPANIQTPENNSNSASASVVSTPNNKIVKTTKGNWLGVNLFNNEESEVTSTSIQKNPPPRYARPPAGRSTTSNIKTVRPTYRPTVVTKQPSTSIRNIIKTIIKVPASKGNRPGVNI